MKKTVFLVSLSDANIRIASLNELRYCLKEVRISLNLIKPVIYYCCKYCFGECVRAIIYEL